MKQETKVYNAKGNPDYLYFQRNGNVYAIEKKTGEITQTLCFDFKSYLKAGYFTLISEIDKILYNVTEL